MRTLVVRAPNDCTTRTGPQAEATSIVGSLARSSSRSAPRYTSALLAERVHRFEGTVSQFTGDGITALFGAPLAHEDHAQRACWAALHLGEALRRSADDLRLGRWWMLGSESAAAQR